jgi:hypothetical protein
VSHFATERLPQPMAVDGETTHDPATRSVLVRVPRVGASFWRRGHAAMMQTEEAGRYGPRSVWAHAPGRRDIARGEPVRDGVGAVSVERRRLPTVGWRSRCACDCGG